MQLYQLAMELDERSADVAERAAALGLGHIDPTSEITYEQAEAIRAAYQRPAGGPAAPPSAPAAPIVGPASSAPEEPARRKDHSGRLKKVGITLGCAAALVGAVAFFAAQASPAEERRKQRSEELAEWESAPPATVAPEVQAAVTFPGNQPRDRAKLCAAAQTAYEHETDSPETEENELDWSEFRAWAADRSDWRTAMDEMVASGPTDAVPDITDYRDLRERYYLVLTRATDPELRALAQGVELNDLDGYADAIDEARADMNAYVTPICGQPTG